MLHGKNRPQWDLAKADAVTLGHLKGDARERIEAAAKDVATAKEYERLAEYLFGTGCAPLLRPACPAPLLTRARCCHQASRGQAHDQEWTRVRQLQAVLQLLRCGCWPGSRLDLATCPSEPGRSETIDSRESCSYRQGVLVIAKPTR